MSVGAGLGPAGLFAAGGSYPTPQAEEHADLVSSRLIDANGRVVQLTDGSGGYEAMNDTSQCVFLLVSNVERPQKRGVGFAEQYAQSIRDALQPLTDGKTPRAEIVSIDVRTSGDLATPRVVYRDLIDGGKTKVYERS